MSSISGASGPSTARQPRRRAVLGLTAAVALGLGTALVGAPSAGAAPSPSQAAAVVNGTVWTTGLNSDGQLGDGSTTTRRTFGGPVLSGVEQVAGGREHVLALDGDGHVWSWGDGSKGAIGSGSTADRHAPARVQGGTLGSGQVLAIATGHYHSLALMPDGTLRAWGFNSMGQLGDGTTAKRTSPVTVKNLPGVVKAMAGGRDMSYAVMSDGTVRAWGGGANGELGNGTTTPKQTTPVTVSGLSGVVQVAAGRNHGLALKSDGTVWSWGLNTSGQLGDGTKTNRTRPVQVKNLSGVKQVTAGADHSVAVLTDGRVFVWGEGGRGQLGLGTKTDQVLPKVVSGLPDIATVANGRDHTLAITSTGALWDWGMDDYGQLGDGGSTNKLRPQQISGISDAVDAGGGRGYTVLLRAG